jgi:hypothetical protein
MYPYWYLGKGGWDRLAVDRHHFGDVVPACALRQRECAFSPLLNPLA